jgi:hypothetical protein
MEMENPDQPDPVVDPIGLLPNIIGHYLSEGDALRLAVDAQFVNARFRGIKLSG